MSNIKMNPNISCSISKTSVFRESMKAHHTSHFHRLRFDCFISLACILDCKAYKSTEQSVQQSIRAATIIDNGGYFVSFGVVRFLGRAIAVMLSIDLEILQSSNQRTLSSTHCWPGDHQSKTAAST